MVHRVEQRMLTVGAAGQFRGVAAELAPKGPRMDATNQIRRKQFFQQAADCHDRRREPHIDRAPRDLRAEYVITVTKQSRHDRFMTLK